MNNISQAQENQVIKLLEDGHTVAQVAVIVRVSTLHVAAIWKIIK